MMIRCECLEECEICCLMEEVQDELQILKRLVEAAKEDLKKEFAEIKLILASGVKPPPPRNLNPLFC